MPSLKFLSSHWYFVFNHLLPNLRERFIFFYSRAQNLMLYYLVTKWNNFFSSFLKKFFFVNVHFLWWRRTYYGSLCNGLLPVLGWGSIILFVKDQSNLFCWVLESISSIMLFYPYIFEHIYGKKPHSTIFHVHR